MIDDKGARTSVGGSTSKPQFDVIQHEMDRMHSAQAYIAYGGVETEEYAIPFLGLKLCDNQCSATRACNIESVHVVSELERRLMQRCQELDSMLQSRGMDVWEGVHLENSTPAEVGRRARNMVQQCSPAEQAAAFQEHLSTSTSDIYQHLQVCGETRAILQTLLQDHRCGDGAKQACVQSEYLYSHLKTVHAKLLTLETQILEATYTVEDLEALKVARAAVEEAMTIKRKEFANAVVLLKEYTDIDSAFDDIVTEYGAVCDQLKHNEWALSELRKDMCHRQY
mmetsp:Transcript_25058/g.47341  ORF Transcript_25058/g.47341 Transcript_25058/m.47341 type:complete len:282 (-) Transcript_25058:40-885(-)